MQLSCNYISDWDLGLHWRHWIGVGWEKGLDWEEDGAFQGWIGRYWRHFNIRSGGGII